MIERNHAKDLYFTSDHEWINFQGSVAYVGICNFKLKGIKVIERMQFAETGALLSKGQAIATIYYDDYQIHVNMPADGRLISFNDLLKEGKSEILLQQAEGAGWIGLISLTQPYERKGLLLPQQYRTMSTNKYLK